MKRLLQDIIEEYLHIFPEEEKNIQDLLLFLSKFNDTQIIDWNNFTGHIVTSGFIYAEKERKFLVLYHKDLKMFLYPGGHMNKKDKNPLESAKREIVEETNLKNVGQVKITENECVPLDINRHKIGYNKRLNLPKHYHFDFRYLFTIPTITTINLDTEELASFKWITIEELEKYLHDNKIIEKLKKQLKKRKLI